VKQKRTTGLYILLAVLMAVDVYAIFNAGNPHSLFRFLIKDPGWDILLTVLISSAIVVVVLLMNSRRTRADDPIYMLLLENKPYIQKLRKKGKNDSEIAASFAANLKVGKLAQKVAYRKALKYLKRI